jgi:hypothetical protein
LQEQERGLVRGVEVVEHEHQRLGVRRPAQQAGHGLEQPEAGALGLQGRRLGEIGEPVAQLRQDLCQRGAAVGEAVSQRVVVEIARVRAQGLDPRPVRRRPPSLPAAPDEDPGIALLGGDHELLGQPALADPGLPGDDRDPASARDRVVEGGGQLRELGPAADERSRCHAAIGHEVERRVLTQDRVVELAQLTARLDPELLDEHRARLAIGLQCLGLATAPVQAQHEPRVQALAQPMRAHESLELADELGVATERRVRADAVLERADAQLVEPHGLRLRERLVGEVRECRAAPHAERVAELLRGRRGRHRIGLRHQPLEARRVDLVALDAQQVAGGLGDEPAVSEHSAHPGDRHLEGLGEGGRRLVAPELVREAIGRHHPVGVQQENREQRALPGSAERERAIVVANLQRAENPEIHP